MVNSKILRFISIGLVACLGVVGCAGGAGEFGLFSSRAVNVTATPFQPLPPTQIPSPSPTATPFALHSISLWLDEGLPAALVQDLRLPPEMQRAARPEEANLLLTPLIEAQAEESEWVYAVAAAFPTLVDDISMDELRRAWSGERLAVFDRRPLLMTASTRRAFETLWGAASSEGVQVVEDGRLLELAWSDLSSWALLPFEALEPRWKVLRVDGVSPLDWQLEPAAYPLTIKIGWSGEPAVVESGRKAVSLPATNRDPLQMTTVVMTGVTALVRSTGAKMETLGMTYPAEEIGDWLRQADFTHISNEVSFDPRCPPADPYQFSLIFCSRPEYIELMEDVGTNIVELSGNHLIDRSRAAFEFTLDLYRQRGWYFYAAGENQADARRPLKLEHNGNRLAFIGCNLPGPPGVFATEWLSGAASCEDGRWLEEEIRALRAEGYLPIVTFQHHESYALKPLPSQERDFRQMSEAGAVIVSGSQAHFPQAMTFVGDHFIHYGLGNLFFDQMRLPDGYGTPFFDDELPIAGTRLEFIDRHIFYGGRYLSTELLTAILEDYARPRPMTAAERQIFLDRVFSASVW